MKDKLKIIEYLQKIGNAYILQVENISVKMEYSANDKSLNECMKNIVKQKYKKAHYNKINDYV